MKDELQPSSSLPLPAPRRPLTLGTLTGLVLLAAVVLLPYFLSRQPAWLDEAIFSYMAQGPDAQGLPYYQAGYDNKPPGIFLLYQLTGAYDPAGLGRMRLLQGVMVLATCLLLLFWLRREVSAAAGWWAAGLYALLLAFTPGVWALTEPPMALCSAAGFCLAYSGLSRAGQRHLRDGGKEQAGAGMGGDSSPPGGGCRGGDTPAASAFPLAGAGLMLGVAATFKQVAVFDLLGLLLVVGVAAGTGRRWVSMAAVLGGALLCAGALALWMIATGQLAPFWDCVVLSPLHGGGVADWSVRAENLVGYWRWILPVIQVPLFVALLTYLRSTRRPLGLLLGVWLVAAVVGVAASGHFLHHQSVQFFAPLAALSGIGGAWLWRRGGTPSAWPRAGVLGLLTLLVFLIPADKYRIRLQQAVASRIQVGASAPERLGQGLQERVPPGDTVYVLGMGMPVYFYAQRRAPTRYFHSLLLSIPALREEAVRDLQAHPPRMLVFAPDYYDAQRAFSARVRAALLPGYRRLPVDRAFPEYEVWQCTPPSERP